MNYHFEPSLPATERPWLARLLFRAVVWARAYSLSRGLGRVRRALVGLDRKQRSELLDLTLKEIGAANAVNPPYLYGSESPSPYEPWGDGTELALRRIDSGNPVLKLRGAALWLALAYHESRCFPYPEMARLHRAVLGELRAIREALAEPEVDDLKRYGLEIKV